MRNKLQYNKIYDYLQPNEISLLGKLNIVIKKYVNYSSIFNKYKIKTRNVHATTYGILKGTFQVNKNNEVNNWFAEKEFDVIVRLSNAHMTLVGNYKIPMYGLAIKLLHNEYTWANFPLVNFPLFPFTNVSYFIKIFMHLNHFQLARGIIKIKYLFLIGFYTLLSLPSFLHPSFIKHAIEFIKNRKKYIMDCEYHSIGVYRWNDFLIKLKLSPQHIPTAYTNESMVTIEEYIKKHGSYKAEMSIQFCYDESKQPINKLNQEWIDSPFIPIGKLVLDEVLDKSCIQYEELSFNPFENIELLQPVGKIQKLRKSAYQSSFFARKSPNK